MARMPFTGLDRDLTLGTLWGLYEEVSDLCFFALVSNS
jgi:hypothetical protein